MLNQLTVERRLEEFRRIDPSLDAFGADNHNYRLKPCAGGLGLEAFESEWEVRLPGEYRHFITTVGNGGAGPYYGMIPLGRAVEEDSIMERDKFLLNQDFPFEAEWDEESEPWPEGLPEDGQIFGSLALSHHGCAYYDRLVISGTQRGQVWQDFRAAGLGLRPLGMSFNLWYQDWLDKDPLVS